MLSIFRLVVGLLFLQHGMQKWFGIPSVNPAYANIQLLTMVGMAGVIEIICGIHAAQHWLEIAQPGRHLTVIWSLFLHNVGHVRWLEYFV